MRGDPGPCDDATWTYRREHQVQDWVFRVIRGSNAGAHRRALTSTDLSLGFSCEAHRRVQMCLHLSWYSRVTGKLETIYRLTAVEGYLREFYLNLCGTRQKVHILADCLSPVPREEPTSFSLETVVPPWLAISIKYCRHQSLGTLLRRYVFVSVPPLCLESNCFQW